MYEKAVLENGETLKSVPDCYKNQEMPNKAVDNYPHALEFVAECFMTHKMCDKVVFLLRHNLFLNVIRLKKRVIKLLINLFLHLFIFLINIRVNK